MADASDERSPGNKLISSGSKRRASECDIRWLSRTFGRGGEILGYKPFPSRPTGEDRVIVYAEILIISGERESGIPVRARNGKFTARGISKHG